MFLLAQSYGFSIYRESCLCCCQAQPATATAATAAAAAAAAVEPVVPQRICCTIQSAPTNNQPQYQSATASPSNAPEAITTATTSQLSSCTFQPAAANCQFQPKPVSVSLQPSPVQCELQSPPIDCEVRSKMVITTTLNGQPTCSCSSSGSPSCTIGSSGRPTCTIMESPIAPKVTFTSNTQPNYYSTPDSSSATVNPNTNVAASGQNCSVRYLLCCPNNNVSNAIVGGKGYSSNASYNTVNKVQSQNVGTCYCCCCQPSGNYKAKRFISAFSRV